MDQPITDYIAFLKEARELMIDLSGLKERQEQLSQEERQLEKNLDTKKKEVATLIQQTIKKRNQEIVDSYDQELNRGQDRLKKARVKREKAKNKGMKERIKEDTEELHSENRELDIQIKTLFHQNYVPSFCNTSLYYSMYFPRHIGEFLRLLLVIAVCFLAAPCGIYLLLPVQKTIYLAGIYMLTILIFGGLYVRIGNITKMRNLAALEHGRLIRDQIYTNHKKIKVITRSIRRDRNDAIYNLQKYDDEIAQMEQELTEIGNRKREALSTFENVTKTILTDEITHNHQPVIDQMKESLEEITKELQIVDQNVKEKSLHAADTYEIYLGKEFMQIKKLDELINIMQNDNAANLNEAIEIHKKNIDVR